MSISAGINVFSVHQELGEDYFGTLEKLAAAGYKNLNGRPSSSRALGRSIQPTRKKRRRRSTARMAERR